MKKDAKFGLAILLLLLVLIIVSTTYAFYSDRVIKNNDTTASITTKKLGIEFSGGSEIVLDALLPGQKIIKTFNVSNTGTDAQTYHLEFLDVLNELSRTGDLVYSLSSTNNGATLNETSFPKRDGTFASDIIIPANTTQEYTMVIEYKNLSENQSVDMNSHIHATIQISDMIKFASALPYIPDETDYTLDPSILEELKTSVDAFNAANNIDPIDWDTANVVIFKTKDAAWWNYSTFIDCLSYEVYVYPSDTLESTWSPNTDFSNFEFDDSSKYIGIRNQGHFYELVKRSIGTQYAGWWVDRFTDVLHYYGEKKLVHVENAKFDFYYYENYPIWVSKSLKTTDGNGVTHEFVGK